MATETIAEIAGGSPDFEMLTAALEAAGLVDAVADPAADLTVFAPSDDAFVGLAQDLGYGGSDEEGALGFLLAVLGVLGDGDPIPLLTDVLLYHVSDGAKLLADIAALSEVDTLLGEKIGVDAANGILIDLEPDISDPALVATDLMASNGVVHVLDGVLIPADLPDEIASDAGRVITTSPGRPIRGGQDGDVIVGTDGDDHLIGGRGAQKIFGGDGDDFVIAGAGDDEVMGGGGDDVIRVNSGDDIALGGDGNDRIFGGPGADFLDGQDGDDYLNGGAGADQLDGGDGDDHLIGGGGNDLIRGFDGDDKLVGQAGNDRLRGNGGNDELYGQAGNDVLDDGGGAGSDTLDGGSGNDRMFGRAGDDVIFGGLGRDKIEGGDDADRFVFVVGDGIDDVLDWEDGIDVIDLSGHDLLNSLDDVLAVAREASGARLFIGEVGASDIIVLSDMTLAQLDETDFIF